MEKDLFYPKVESQRSSHQSTERKDHAKHSNKDDTNPKDGNQAETSHLEVTSRDGVQVTEQHQIDTQIHQVQRHASEINIYTQPSADTV